METTAKLTEIGQSLGLSGQELGDWITQQQNEYRAERNAAREEKERERVENERQRQHEEKIREEERNEKARGDERAEKQRQHDEKMHDEAERQRQHEERMKDGEAKAGERQQAGEREKREFDAKEKEKERLHELEVLKMNQVAVANSNNNALQSQSADSMSGRTPSLKLPPFNDTIDSFDAYLLRFEQVAESEQLPREKWAVSLSRCLQGNALDVYSRISPTEISDYEVVKSALNRRYGLTEDGYKQAFKACTPHVSETCKQFVTRLAHYLDRWWEMSAVEKTVVGIRDLLLRDQLNESCTQELSTFVLEHKCKSLGEMSELVDTFVLAHGGAGLKCTGDGGKAYGNNERRNGMTDYNNQNPRHMDGTTQRSYGRQGCYTCGSQHHFAKDCPKPKTPRKILGQAMMPVQRGLVGDTDVSVLRDSGCSGVVVKRNLVRDDQLTGENQEVVMIDGTSRYAPEAILDINTPYYSGAVSAICFDSPLFDVVVGNIDGVKDAKEIADDEMMGGDRCETKPNANVATTTSDEGNTNTENISVHADADVENDVENGVEGYAENDVGGDIESDVENVSTTSVDKEMIGENIGEELPMRILNDIVKESVKNAIDIPKLDSMDDNRITGLGVNLECGLAVETRAEVKQRRVLRPLSLPIEIGNVDIHAFQNDQENDPSLNRMRSKIDSNGRYPVIMKRNLMYRQYKDKSNRVISQLIVPDKYRNAVLKLAHDCIMSGHLGIRKTQDKILTQFYWPGIYEDVTRYVRSCDSCQRTVAKGSVTKVPLGRMPVIDTPFERIAVDLIGPIEPMSERRHRYILTVVDFATRYPEAIALPNIETVTVAEGLVDIFCRVGIPSEVLSDRGAQFMSEIMREVSRMLSIRQLVTTPYHPMCNGLVERFNGTLKQMLRRMCEERPKDWDRYLGPALFSYREAPQESLGFSPFELLQGRTVKGPMAVLKSLMTGEVDDPEVKTTYQYVVDLRERIDKTCELARQELNKASARYKKQYDSKAKERNMQVGDKVLVLLPTHNNKLLMKWRGPFEIIQKIGVCDYRIQADNGIKTYHANMLKQYHERTTGQQEETRRVQCCATLFSEGDEEQVNPQIMFPPLTSTQNSSDVKVCDTLTESQRDEVKCLLEDVGEILTDIPGKTNLLEYDIKLTTNDPVRQKQYPVPHAVKEAMEEEIESMLKMGIIEPSSSSYNSPVVLVKKPDGTNRFCIDYRRLNRVTVFDTEPIPSTDDLFATLTHDRYFTKLDLTKGYWQIPLSESTKDKTTFSSDSGSYRFKYLPFGLVCAPAVFTKMMRRLLGGIKKADNYIDDILIHTQTWEEHIQVVREVMGRLKGANLTIKPSKCHIGYGSIEFLGHVISNGKIQPLTTTLDKIQRSSRPTTKTQVRAFVGLSGYYRKYIPNYAAIAVPLTDLTRKSQPTKVQWGESQEKAFRHLKGLLSTEPILRLPDFDRPFVVRTDASDVGIGAVLLQADGSELFPVSYASRKLLPREKNYSVIERECLAIVWGIDKFYVFLYGKEFILQTDHKPLSYLNEAKLSNTRVLRWALSLQEYKFRIQDIRGVDNHCADYLSRMDV